MKRPTHPRACEAWLLLQQLFSSHRAHLPSVAAQFELSPAQCQVLRLIEPGRPVSMGHLAEALACDASNVTGLIDRLETRRLVERRATADDRRKKVLGLTSTGTRLRAQLIERMAEPPPALARLSVEEQRTLVKILRHMLE